MMLRAVRKRVPVKAVLNAEYQELALFIMVPWITMSDLPKTSIRCVLK